MGPALPAQLTLALRSGLMYFALLRKFPEVSLTSMFSSNQIRNSVGFRQMFFFKSVEEIRLFFSFDLCKGYDRLAGS